MNQEMRAKIDKVLERVKEPETRLSVRDLQLVRKLTYGAAEKTLLVVMDNPEARQKCFCTGMVTSVVRRGLMRELAQEFQKEFPDLKVELV